MERLVTLTLPLSRVGEEGYIALTVCLLTKCAVEALSKIARESCAQFCAYRPPRLIAMECDAAETKSAPRSARFVRDRSGISETCPLMERDSNSGTTEPLIRAVNKLPVET
jgi:hypothetical protein